MKERPIIFTADSVAAILAGRKTQTRRVVKPQPPAEVRDVGVIWSSSASNGLWCWLDSTELEDASCVGDDFRCPFGVPGDRLWVREAAWFDKTPIDGMPLRCFFEGRDMRFANGTVGQQPFASVAELLDLNDSLRKRSPMFMPRWASRITLEITWVRCEQLNSISEADCAAEGVIDAGPGSTVMEFGIGQRRYRELWESIHGPGSWEKNPWVWALSFSKVPA